MGKAQYKGQAYIFGFVSLSHYGSNGYTTVILDNSDVSFLKEMEDAAFCPSVYCVLIIYGVAVLE